MTWTTQSGNEINIGGMIGDAIRLVALAGLAGLLGWAVICGS